jgi:hypothetical protein
MRKLITNLILFFCLSFLKLAFAQDLTINSDIAWEPGTYTYGNVWITNGATLTFNGKVILNATNLSIDSGSSISADEKGYPADQGPGAGSNGSWWSGSGAGYGGKGGKGSCESKSGLTYGSATIPIDLGSGGGSGYGYPGGSGGGAIQLVISDTLTNNGLISSNGQDALGERSQSGGGSGGSVYITTKGFSGSGSIKANGGKGGPWGGC